MEPLLETAPAPIESQAPPQAPAGDPRRRMVRELMEHYEKQLDPKSPPVEDADITGTLDYYKGDDRKMVRELMEHYEKQLDPKAPPVTDEDITGTLDYYVKPAAKAAPAEPDKQFEQVPQAAPALKDDAGLIDTASARQGVLKAPGDDEAALGLPLPSGEELRARAEKESLDKLAAIQGSVVADVRPVDERRNAHGAVPGELPYGMERVVIPKDHDGQVPENTVTDPTTGLRYFDRPLSNLVDGKPQSVYEGAKANFFNSLKEMEQGAVETAGALHNVLNAAHDAVGLDEKKLGYDDWADRKSAEIEAGKDKVSDLNSRAPLSLAHPSTIVQHTAEYAPLIVAQVAQTLAPELRAPAAVSKVLGLVTTLGFDAQMMHTASQNAEKAGLKGREKAFYTLAEGSLTLAGFKVGSKVMSALGDKLAQKLAPDALRDRMAQDFAARAAALEAKLGRELTKKETAEALSQSIRQVLPGLAQPLKEGFQQAPVFAGAEAARTAVNQTVAPALGGKADDLTWGEFGLNLLQHGGAGVGMGVVTGLTSAALGKMAKPGSAFDVNGPAPEAAKADPGAVPEPAAEHTMLPLPALPSGEVLTAEVNVAGEPTRLFHGSRELPKEALQHPLLRAQVADAFGNQAPVAEQAAQAPEASQPEQAPEAAPTGLDAAAPVGPETHRAGQSLAELVPEGDTRGALVTFNGEPAQAFRDEEGNVVVRADSGREQVFDKGDTLNARLADLGIVPAQGEAPRPVEKGEVLAYRGKESPVTKIGRNVAGEITRVTLKNGRVITDQSGEGQALLDALRRREAGTADPNPAPGPAQSPTPTTLEDATASPATNASPDSAASATGGDSLAEAAAPEGAGGYPENAPAGNGTPEPAAPAGQPGAAAGAPDVPAAAPADNAGGAGRGRRPARLRLVGTGEMVDAQALPRVKKAVRNALAKAGLADHATDAIDVTDRAAFAKAAGIRESDLPDGSRLLVGKNGATGLAISPSGEIIGQYAHESAGEYDGLGLLVRAAAEGGKTIVAHNAAVADVYVRLGLTPVGRTERARPDASGTDDTVYFTVDPQKAKNGGLLENWEKNPDGWAAVKEGVPEVKSLEHATALQQRQAKLEARVAKRQARVERVAKRIEDKGRELKAAAKGKAYASLPGVDPKTVGDALELVAKGLRAGNTVIDALDRAIEALKERASGLGEDVQQLRARVLADLHELVPPPTGQLAYHGTPHEFDKFTTAAMGTGEGAQVYGWGMYFAGDENVAESYANTLGQTEYRYKGKPVDTGIFAEHPAELVAEAQKLIDSLPENMKPYGGDAKALLSQAVADMEWALEDPADFEKSSARLGNGAYNRNGIAARELARRLAEQVEVVQKKHLYEVELHPGKEKPTWLGWDEPVAPEKRTAIAAELKKRGLPDIFEKSPEQRKLAERLVAAEKDVAELQKGLAAATDPAERRQLQNLLDDARLDVKDLAARSDVGASGGAVVRQLEDLASPREAAEILHAAGYDGNRVPKNHTRGTSSENATGPTDFNYVIYNDDHVRVRNRIAVEAGKKPSATRAEKIAATLERMAEGIREGAKGKAYSVPGLSPKQIADVLDFVASATRKGASLVSALDKAVERLKSRNSGLVFDELALRKEASKAAGLDGLRFGSVEELILAYSGKPVEGAADHADTERVAAGGPKDVRERRARATLGPDKPGLRERAQKKIKAFGEAMTETWHEFSRMIPELDPKKYARETDLLRRRLELGAEAKLLATEHVMGLTRHLTVPQNEILGELIDLEDLDYALENGKDDVNNISHGWESVQAVKDRVAELRTQMAKEPALQAAYDHRKQVVQNLYAEMVKYKLLSPGEDSMRPYFHRRMVFRQAEEEARVAGPGNARKIARRLIDSQKRRTGANGHDYSTNFHEAELFYLTDALTELNKAKWLEELTAPYVQQRQAAEAQAKADHAAELAKLTPGTADYLKLKRDKAAWVNQRIVDQAYQPADYEMYAVNRNSPLLVKGVTESQLDAIINEMVKSKGQGGPAAFIQMVADLTDATRTFAMKGRASDTYHLPSQLVDALTAIEQNKGAASDSHLARLARGFVNELKGYLLFAPQNIIRYSLNNAIGDLDARIGATGVKIAKGRTTAAAKILLSQMRDGKLHPALLEATKGGVLDSGEGMLALKDLHESAFLDLVFNRRKRELGQSVKPSVLERLGNAPGAARDAYMRYVAGINTFRERTVRLAAFLEAKEALDAGKAPVWASDYDQIKSLRDQGYDSNRIAAKLAREAIGDYGALSRGGQQLRRYLLPFYSFAETNARRYFNLWRNSLDPRAQTRMVAALTARGIGAVAATMLLRQTSIWAFTAMTLAWNRAMFPDEDKALRRDPSQTGLYMILSAADKGRPRVLPIQGAHFEFLQNFGLPEAAPYLGNIAAGDGVSKNAAKAFQAVWQAPITKAVGMVNPLAKAPVELYAGKQAYPDPFNPRPILDKGEYVAGLLGARAAYLAEQGGPARPQTLAQKAANVFTRQLDTEQSLYYAAKRLVREYTGGSGAPTPGEDETSAPRKAALRDAVKAKRLGLSDEEQQRFRDAYTAAGGTDQGLATSLRNADPLHALPAEAKAELERVLAGELSAAEAQSPFVQRLTRTEVDILRRARAYYEQFLAPEAHGVSGGEGGTPEVPLSEPPVGEPPLEGMPPAGELPPGL